MNHSETAKAHGDVLGSAHVEMVYTDLVFNAKKVLLKGENADEKGAIAGILDEQGGV